ncbi:MAG: serine/threonine protein kinase [Verrucomicrobiae bacterium]|nr:serine/threonine protein kinase [Verrucomicrobiae bacterium]
MPEETPVPDEAAIEAWLAGRLSPDEAEALERLMAVGNFAVDEDGIDARALRAVPKAEAIRKQALLETQQRIGGSSRTSDLAMESPGELIGRYRLVERIGRGGFGDVWRAEQTEPIKRFVALKVIKLGMDTEEVLARFDAERQALAIMEHPNIATVLDAGATETGRPFFVMELVDGVPIDRYCEERELGTRQRLELFAAVCSAVQHAHHKAVMHRDLKPSNILVSDHNGYAVPKVIDFGLAKATTQSLTEHTRLTRNEQLMGTPAYMSPEQASATSSDVDTRSDVYSLGVLLYELLTGAPPFDPDELVADGYEEMMRIIREVDPPVPSARLRSQSASGSKSGRSLSEESLSKLLRQDLDWVVMRAIEKDREQRYQSVGALGDDVLRYLEGQPVSAVAPSAGYRLAKFYRRNKAGVLAGAAMVGLLVAGTAVSTWQAWRAKKNEARAVKSESAALEETEKARRLVQMVKVMLDSADANNRSSPNYTVREMLDDFSRGRMWEQLADDPAVEAELRGIVASCYQSLGRDEEALEHAARGLVLRRESATGADKLKVADDIANVANLHYSLGDLDQASLLLEEGMAIEHQLGDIKRVARTSMTLSKIYAGEGKFDLAEKTARASLKLQEQQFQPGDHDYLLDARSTLALILRKQDKSEESLALYRQTAADARRDLGVHPRTAGAVHNLATALRVAGQPVEAEKAFKEAIQLRLQFLEPGDSKVCMTIHSLAQALEDQGRLDEAEALHRKALADRIEKTGKAHIDIARAQYWLADNLEKQNRIDEADAYRREAEALVEQMQETPQP